MKLRRIIAPILALICMISGFVMAYRVFGQFRDNIISQHGEKLADVADSVDRSARGYFQIYYDSLDYVTGRRGFAEAESLWHDTGDTEELLFRLEENLLNLDMQVKNILAIHDGEVILSADGNTRYVLPEELKDVFICRDFNGVYYLGILHKRECLSYAIFFLMLV